MQIAALIARCEQAERKTATTTTQTVATKDCIKCKKSLPKDMMLCGYCSQDQSQPVTTQRFAYGEPLAPVTDTVVYSSDGRHTPQLYVFGLNYNRTLVWSEADSAWRECRPLNTPVQAVQAVCVHDAETHSVYLVCGKTAYKCDLLSGVWTRLKDLPDNIDFASGGVHEHKLIVRVGYTLCTLDIRDATAGWEDLKRDSTSMHWRIVGNYMYVVDAELRLGIVTGDRQPIANFPRGVRGIGLCVHEHSIYVVGGQLSSDKSIIAQSWRYDTREDKWTRLADKPTACAYTSLTMYRGRLYAVGGTTTATNQSANALSCVESYDPQTDTWRVETNMTLPAAGFFLNALSF